MSIGPDPDEWIPHITQMPAPGAENLLSVHPLRTQPSALTLPDSQLRRAGDTIGDGGTLSSTPQFQQAVRAKLMTFEELQENIGHAPRADRFIGIWKRSTEYKVLQTAVNDSRKVIVDLENTPLSELSEKQTIIHEELANRLAKLGKAATAYRDRRSQTEKKKRLRNGSSTKQTAIKAGLRRVLKRSSPTQTSHKS